MGRHFVGVIAGYLFFGLASAALLGASGVDPRLSPTFGIALLTIFAGIVFAVAAGFFASIVSPFGSRAARHLAIVMAVFAAIFAVAEWRTGSVWSQIVTIFVLAPSALIGGINEERRSRSDSLPNRSS
jgi:hypothetical protein